MSYRCFHAGRFEFDEVVLVGGGEDLVPIPNFCFHEGMEELGEEVVVVDFVVSFDGDDGVPVLEEPPPFFNTDLKSTVSFPLVSDF